MTTNVAKQRAGAAAQRWQGAATAQHFGSTLAKEKGMANPPPRASIFIALTARAAVHRNRMRDVIDSQ